MTSEWKHVSSSLRNPASYLACRCKPIVFAARWSLFLKKKMFHFHCRESITIFYEIIYSRSHLCDFNRSNSIWPILRSSSWIAQRWLNANYMWYRDMECRLLSNSISRHPAASWIISQAMANKFLTCQLHENNHLYIKRRKHFASHWHIWTEFIIHLWMCNGRTIV